MSKSLPRREPIEVSERGIGSPNVESRQRW